MERSSILQTRPFWYCISIGLLAFFLRFYKLGAQALFFDEAHSWLTSQYPLTDLLGILQHENHLPFYYLLLKIYLKIAPHTEIGLRSFSLIFSMLSFGLLIWLTNRWWGVRASLFAGWLMAISSFEIYYAQDARMYTLLSFQWLVSLGLLVLAITRRPKMLLPWAINLVILSYVQATGLILAAVHSAVIGVFWLFGTVHQKRHPLPFEIQSNLGEWSFFRVGKLLANNTKWVLISGGIIAIGVTPTVMTLLATDNWRGIGGGVWIPTLKDFPNLFILSSTGITAARNYFLDHTHLTIPFFSGIPNWCWFLVSLMIGGLVVLGVYWAWKVSHQKRLFMSVILISMLAPPITVWLLGSLLNQHTWAYKSFLEVTLLFYMLAGVGFSRLKRAWLRRFLIGITLGIALLSLIPYYTIWQKADTRAAFSDLPQVHNSGIVLMEKTYLSPLAHFYLGRNASLIGLVPDADDEKIFFDIQFGTGYLYGHKTISCSQIQRGDIENIWIYGRGDFVRKYLETRPDCFNEAKLWIFENGTWKPFEL